MEFLYFLEKIRMPILNEAMLLITQLGEETAFLVVAILVFWCVDKNKGYYVLGVGLFGTVINQALKLVCQVPRPWVMDPEFTILEQARAAATGFSFPSGHSTSSVATFGSIAVFAKRKWIKGICLFICVIVPFSRMYIGVHTPMDVLVGVVTSGALILAMRPITLGASHRAMRDCFGFLLICSIILLLYVSWYPFNIMPEEYHNVESGVKNAYTLVGCACGLLIGYPIEKKYVNFTTKAVWWAQIMKGTLGLLLVLAVKEGLRAPLDLLFNGHMAARAIRYCMTVLTAGVLWPMSFRWFSRVGVQR